MQAATDTINIWGVFENKEHLLQPGGVVTIRVGRSSDKPVPAIPTGSVLTDTRGHYTFVLHNGRAKLTRIHCGTAADDGLTPVYSGVCAGDQVITTNLAALEDGTPVTIEQ